MEEKIYSIYCHINKINYKRYIGLTYRPLAKRWKNGKGYSKQHQPIFFAAIDKYGWDNFEHIILEENIVGYMAACEREKYWIAYYHTCIKDPLCNGYNMTPGGNYCNFTGCHHTDEAKQKISAAAKMVVHRKLTPAECEAIRIRNTGYRHTDEAKRKISLASKGHTLSAASRQKLSNSKKGKLFSEEHKKALHKQHKSPWKLIKIKCIELDTVFDTLEQASAVTGVYLTNIRKVCNGERQTAGGYHWQSIKSERSATAALADLLS